MSEISFHMAGHLIDPSNTGGTCCWHPFRNYLNIKGETISEKIV